MVDEAYIKKEILFILIGKDKIELVIIRLFTSIASPEHLQLDRSHNTNRPTITLLLQRSHNSSYKLPIGNSLFIPTSFTNRLRE